MIITMTKIFPSIVNNFLLSLCNTFYHSTSDLCNLWFVLCHFSFAISRVLYKWVYTAYIILSQTSFNLLYILFFKLFIFFILLVDQQCVSFLLLSRIPFHRFTWMHLSFHMWMHILVALNFLDVMCKAAITIQYNFFVWPIYFSLLSHLQNDRLFLQNYLSVSANYTNYTKYTKLRAWKLNDRAIHSSWIRNLKHKKIHPTPSYIMVNCKGIK